MPGNIDKIHVISGLLTLYCDLLVVYKCDLLCLSYVRLFTVSLSSDLFFHNSEMLS